MRNAMRTLPILLILVYGCAARVPGGSRAATPIENALAYNASLADANHTLADSAITLQKSGGAPVATVTSITSISFTVADADKQITSILNAIATCQAQAKAANSSCTGNATQMQTLVSRIAANASTLVNSGDLGIKDAKAQSTVTSSAALLSQMANSILSILQGAKLLQ